MANTYSINPQTINYPIHSTTGPTATMAGLAWANSITTNSVLSNPGTQFSSNGNAVMSIPSDGNTVVIEDAAALDVKGKIILNGESLNDRLERIETLLHIPTRDVTMEDKHPKLKRLWEEYNNTLAKYKTWDAIKGDK